MHIAGESIDRATWNRKGKFCSVQGKCEETVWRETEQGEIEKLLMDEFLTLWFFDDLIFNRIGFNIEWNWSSFSAFLAE